MLNKIVYVIGYTIGVILAILMIAGLLGMAGIGLATFMYVANDPFYYDSEIFNCLIAMGTLGIFELIMFRFIKVVNKYWT